MSNADQLRVSIVEEVTYGTHPGGSLQDLRVTSESLAQATAHAESAELRTDRQVSDRIRTNINVEGDLGIELSYGSFDDLLAAALYTSTTWAASADLSLADCDVTAATGTITDGAAGGGLSGAVVGRWIKISGMSNAANNGYFKILTAPSTDTITVAGLAAMADELAGAPTITMGAQITNGTEQSSFSLEKKFGDLTNEFEIVNGIVVATSELTVPSDGIITGSFGVLGKIAASAAASAGSGYTSPTTTAVMNGIDHVVGMIVGTPAVNTANEVDAMAIGWETANNLRERSIIGTLGPKSIGAGKFAAEGTLQSYLESEALIDLYLNWTDSAVSTILEDAAGNAYVVEFPRVKWTDGKRVAGGENTDILADLSFGAFMHETELVTMRIVKFAA
jgi:hypothetical protein